MQASVCQDTRSVRLKWRPWTPGAIRIKARIHFGAAGEHVMDMYTIDRRNAAVELTHSLRPWPRLVRQRSRRLEYSDLKSGSVS